MPTYEYKCQNCNDTIEVLQKITEDPLKNCPSCSQNTLIRGIGGGIGLNFTGNGYYITDYVKGAKECCPCGESSNSCSKGKS
ncbi:MAG: FmdB family zinc ribbon protein [Parachlamydiaceae bacterium]